MESPKVRFGLIGAGGIAQTYAQAFPKCANAELTAIADVRKETAEAMATSMGCQAYTDHRDMLENNELDAVVVCTPPSTHPEICNWLLNNGVHVLCEKPIAVDSQSAISMVETAEQVGRKLTMASKFRYAEDVIKTKSIMSSGILGDIILFENCFTATVDMTKRWNSNAAVSGGGVLIDNGTHSVDIMRYLLGPLSEIQAIEGKRVQDIEVEDTVRVFARSQKGVMGSIDLSWSIKKEQPYYISIYGSQGTILVGWGESKYRRSSDDAWIVFGKGYDKVQAFRSQIENFSNSIRGTEALVITSEDALASVRVIETAYESLWNDRWLPVNSFPRRATVG